MPNEILKKRRNYIYKGEINLQNFGGYHKRKELEWLQRRLQKKWEEVTRKGMLPKRVNVNMKWQI